MRLILVRYSTHFRECPVSVTIAVIGVKTGSRSSRVAAESKTGRSIGDCDIPVEQTSPYSAQASLSDGYPQICSSVGINVGISVIRDGPEGSDGIGSHAQNEVEK